MLNDRYIKSFPSITASGVVPLQRHPARLANIMQIQGLLWTHTALFLLKKYNMGNFLFFFLLFVRSSSCPAAAAAAQDPKQKGMKYLLSLAVCASQVTVTAWGQSSTNSVSCERTGRARLRPSKNWPMIYCILRSVVSAAEAGACCEPPSSRVTSSGWRWLKRSPKAVITSFRQEQMSAGDFQLLLWRFKPIRPLIISAGSEFFFHHR